MKCILCDECGKTIPAEDNFLYGTIRLGTIKDDCEILTTGSVFIYWGQQFCRGGECLMKHLVKELEKYEGKR